MIDFKLTKIETKDIRFPTSENLDGSDAMNPDPDYSAAYVTLKTDHPEGLEGHGLTFTIGHGNELCVQAIKSLSYLVIGKSVLSFTKNMGEFWRMITGNSQLRWLGPEKAVLLMAAKFEIPVCPHAGGVGLCEHVQHLSMIDYLCISGSMEDRIIEYVDHLHDHFKDPVMIKNGNYTPPTLPGYSIEMKEESLKTYDFENGTVWKKRKFSNKIG